MIIQTNTTDRKALAHAIADALGTTAHYEGMPTRAYTIGEYTVDRDGNIVGEDFTALQDFLVANGYGGGATQDEADVEPTADSGADRPGINTQTITIPAPGITPIQLKNLTFMIFSRQHILNRMSGGETIHIPVALVEALKETLPATPDEFTALLDGIAGLEGFDFRNGQFTLTFPFYETEPIRWTTFAGLQGRILQAAMEATRVFPEEMIPDEENEKYLAHTWLQRLGYRGPEMKEQRNILLKHLRGYCAFANGAKMQRHREKYRHNSEATIAESEAAVNE